MAGLAHPHCSERSSDRMASLRGQMCRTGSPITRRSALKHLLVEHRKASTGITASIAKLTKSAGTSEPSKRTEHGAASSKAIDVCLSARRQTRPIPLRLGGTGGDRYVVTVSSWRPTARRQPWRSLLVLARSVRVGAFQPSYLGQRHGRLALTLPFQPSQTTRSSTAPTLGNHRPFRTSCTAHLV